MSMGEYVLQEQWFKLVDFDPTPAWDLITGEQLAYEDRLIYTCCIEKFSTDERQMIYMAVPRAMLNIMPRRDGWALLREGKVSEPIGIGHKSVYMLCGVRDGTRDTEKLNPKDAAAQTRAPMHLLPAAGAIHGCMACRDGAAKYGPYNWRERPISLMEYIGAMERHIARLKDGEWTDAKSGVSHLGHINATSSILLDAHECGTMIDDRPGLPGQASALLDEIELKLRDMEKTDNE